MSALDPSPCVSIVFAGFVLSLHCSIPQQQGRCHVDLILLQVAELHSRINGADIEREAVMQENSALENEIAALKESIEKLDGKVLEKAEELEKLQVWAMHWIPAQPLLHSMPTPRPCPHAEAAG